MAYSDFTIDQVAQDFGLKVREQALLEGVGAIEPSAWLRETLARYHALAFMSEKSRSEFIVAPVLAECRALLDNQIYIYSGVGLDVDRLRGLHGECDFLLAHTPPTPVLEAPLLIVVEAKKNDIELGLGQCAAQLLAARLFNERRQRPIQRRFGCVTTGEAWQLTKLDGQEFLIHDERFYIRDVAQVLWALTSILKDGVAQVTGVAA